MSPPSTTTLLQEFLAQPNIEASPAWELIDGHKIQKPMPTLFHSRLQRNLMNYINAHAKGFEAIQEFRCLVPPYSPVPNISAVAVERLPQEDGPLEGAPDWLIENCLCWLQCFTDAWRLARANRHFNNGN
jgi:Uma2 family endonuclease